MNAQIKETRNYIYGHTCQDNAYLVQDYPWGFRLRTSVRYWIESKDAKNGGQRFGRQTINPKTGLWCEPKYSTYSPIGIMFLDENNHVHWECLNMYSDEKTILEFKETHLSKMDEFQKDQLRLMMAYTEVMKHVTYTVTPSKYGSVSLLSKDPEEIKKRELIEQEQEENKKEKMAIEAKINRAIGYHYNKNKELIA